MLLGFEWDENKAWANEEKHGVSFEEAASVWHAPARINDWDEAHSTLSETATT